MISAPWVVLPANELSLQLSNLVLPASRLALPSSLATWRAPSATKITFRIVPENFAYVRPDHLHCQTQVNGLKDATKLLPVDISTVVATHFKPVKQVFSTITFREAHGATAYWLHQVSRVDGEDYIDAVVENYAPYFSRVRLPVGTHRLIIESRNTSYSIHSEMFEFEVPAL